MNLYATSRAHAPAREARSRVEAILEQLRTARSASLDRRGAADRLSRAIRALYIVLDTTQEAPAHHDALEECTRVLGEMRPLLGAAIDDHVVAGALGALDAVIAIVASARDQVVDAGMLSRRAPARGATAPARPFRVSIGVPRLHALAASSLAPALVIEPPDPVSVPQPKKAPPPKPKTIEELRAMAKATPAAPEPAVEAASTKDATPPPVDDGEVVRRVARECLEDIASFRALRKPIPTETWLDQAPFEQRLLDNIDAFVSLGERALPSVTLFHAEAPAPDPARAFAVALTLGSIEGTAPIDIAVATMKAAAPEELPAFAEGFTLAPSPAIDVELPALFAAPNPALAGLALDVLGARGTLPIDTGERILERNDPSLFGKLARAFGTAGAKSKAIAALNELLAREPSLFFLATKSLLRRGDPHVRDRLRERLPSSFWLLALSGRGTDAPLLLDAFTGPTASLPTNIRALGRFGSVAAIPVLIGLLDSKDEGVPEAAAWALDFMTGAGLVASKEVPWSPNAEATRTVTVPVVDRDVWDGWYARMKPQLDPRSKLRYGRPFVPSMIADELRSNGSVLHRADAAFELVVATGLGMRFEIGDWVVRQQHHLGEVAELLPSLGSDAGAWWYAGNAAR